MVARVSKVSDEDERRAIDDENAKAWDELLARPADA